MHEYERLYAKDEASTTRLERRTARKQLKDLRTQLVTVPTAEISQSKKTCATFNECRRDRNFHILGINLLQDGVALSYVTEGWLEYRSHRFVFPEDEDIEPAYHREPFFIDCQAIDSEKLDVSGVERLVADRNIVAQIGFISVEVQEAARIGWNFEQRIVRIAEC